MNAPHFKSRLRQQGMVAVMAVLLLITAVIFALSQTFGITGSNSIDNEKQMDSEAVVFLAESGLERGQAVLTSANPITAAVCETTIASSNSLGGGGGTVTVSGKVSPVVIPACGGATPCDSCTIKATGALRSASRTIQRTLNIAPIYGIACKTTNPTTDCSTVSLTLKNPNPTAAVAIFNLVTQRQGNQDAAACDGIVITSGTTADCYQAWNVNGQNGQNSVGGMGSAVTIAGSTSATIHQTLSSSRDYAEIGAFFSGSAGVNVIGTFTAGAPPIKYDYGYWDDTNPAGGGDKTVGKTADSDGQTNNGTATLPGVCTTTPALGSKQVCTNWCYGGDMLVFGFAGHSAALTDELRSPGGVLFNTAGTPAQSIGLSRLVRFPTGSDTGAPAGVDAEIWYAHNTDYLSNPTASSGGVVTGAIGVTSFTGATTFPANSNILTVSVPSDTLLQIGDTIFCTGGGPCPIQAGTKITAFGSGTGGAGTYTILPAATGFNAGRAMRGERTSNVLSVTSVSNGYLSVGDTITGSPISVAAGTTITSVPGTCSNNTCNLTGSYGISTAQTVSSTTITANGYTIHVTGGTVPTTIPVGTPAVGTLVAVKSGFVGQFQGRTAVASGATDTLFRVVDFDTGLIFRPPTTRLVNAQICGGTCAFFDQASATTTFTIDKTGGTGGINYWASGFTCLKGADATPNAIPITTKTKAGAWSEVVQ
jgi:hypothetical protein